eukprot:873150-Heterocapsa_arctica.AAC.1
MVVLRNSDISDISMVVHKTYCDRERLGLLLPIDDPKEGTPRKRPRHEMTTGQSEAARPSGT